MDTLRYITYYQDVSNNWFSAFKYWNQGQHKGLLIQAVTWLNIYFFSLNPMVLNFLSGFILFLTSLLFIKVFFTDIFSELEVKNNLIVLFTGILFCFAVFNFASFELFTLDIGFAEFFRNFLFLLTAWWIYTNERLMKNWQIFAIFFLIIFVVFFCAYGRAYAFASAVLGASAIDLIKSRKLKIKFKYTLPTGIVFLIALCFFILSTIDIDGGARTSIEGEFQIILRRLLLLPYALAGNFIGVEAAAKYGFSRYALLIAGSFWLFVLLFSASHIFIFYKKEINPFPIFLIFYGLFSAIVFCIARGGNDDYSAVMASRYYIDVSWFGIGSLWIIVKVAVTKDNFQIIQGKNLYGAIWFIFVIFWGSEFA